jgi:integration host factor subunit alpha
MALTKADIVDRIYKEVGFSKKDAAEMVDLVFDVIKDTLGKGEKVKISGFGNFSIRDKSTRMGRNPQTGDSMEITARRVLTFKASTVLREDVCSRYAHRLNAEGEEDLSLPAREGTERAVNSFMANLKDDDDDDDDESGNDSGESGGWGGRHAIVAKGRDY